MAGRENRQGSRTKGADHCGNTPPGDPLGTALWLLGRGLWPAAVSPPGDPRWPNAGKSPIGRGWGTRRATASALRRVYARHPRAGVALLLGPAGGIVDLECDEPEVAELAIAGLFPRGAPETMGWRSARGEHRLFAWDDRLSAERRTAVVSLAGGGLELRLGGRGKQLASVCPPSVGADGTPRVWNGCWRIAPFPQELARAVHDERARHEVPVSRRLPRPGRGPARTLAGLGRYGAAALARESDSVRGAQPGGRNRTLNRAAFSLGQLVASGAIDRIVVERALLDAALECGLVTKEAEATIRSGIDAGLARPRQARG